MQLRHLGGKPGGKSLGLQNLSQSPAGPSHAQCSLAHPVTFSLQTFYQCHPPVPVGGQIIGASSTPELEL